MTNFSPRKDALRQEQSRWKRHQIILDNKSHKADGRDDTTILSQCHSNISPISIQSLRSPPLHISLVPDFDDLLGLFGQFSFGVSLLTSLRPSSPRREKRHLLAQVGGYCNTTTLCGGLFADHGVYPCFEADAWWRDATLCHLRMGCVLQLEILSVHGASPWPLFLCPDHGSLFCH